LIADDGTDLVLEHDAAGAWLQSYVHGPGADEPLVAYPSTQPGQRRFSHADRIGSIVALSDNSGAMVAINKYDEFGRPATTNVGMFGYNEHRSHAGGHDEKRNQAWLWEVGEYYYKARNYDPELGRFLQPDPIGIMNIGKRGP
jgi:RHS repeat-associated protein